MLRFLQGLSVAETAEVMVSKNGCGEAAAAAGRPGAGEAAPGAGVMTLRRLAVTVAPGRSLSGRSHRRGRPARRAGGSSTGDHGHVGSTPGSGGAAAAARRRPGEQPRGRAGPRAAARSWPGGSPLRRLRRPPTSGPPCGSGWSAKRPPGCRLPAYLPSGPGPARPPGSGGPSRPSRWPQSSAVSAPRWRAPDRCPATRSPG